jgi:hypothetical protein
MKWLLEEADDSELVTDDDGTSAQFFFWDGDMKFIDACYFRVSSVVVKSFSTRDYRL